MTEELNTMVDDYETLKRKYAKVKHGKSFFEILEYNYITEQEMETKQ